MQIRSSVELCRVCKMTADQKSACKAVEAGERPVEKPKGIILWAC